MHERPKFPSVSLMIFRPRRFEEALAAYDRWDDDRLTRLYHQRSTASA